jgi:hypothetical protein
MPDEMPLLANSNSCIASNLWMGQCRRKPVEQDCCGSSLWRPRHQDRQRSLVLLIAPSSSSGESRRSCLLRPVLDLLMSTTGALINVGYSRRGFLRFRRYLHMAEAQAGMTLEPRIWPRL